MHPAALPRHGRHGLTDRPRQPGMGVGDDQHDAVPAGVCRAPSCRRSSAERSPRRLPWIRTDVAVDVACQTEDAREAVLGDQRHRVAEIDIVEPEQIPARVPSDPPESRWRGRSSPAESLDGARPKSPQRVRGRTEDSAKRRKLLSNKLPGQRVFPGISADQRNPLIPSGGQEVAGSNPASPTRENPCTARVPVFDGLG